ncbi:MAG TPA: FecR domain-containing protein [Caulobacteraceae bacterium]|jgi:transmembrane sensor|nr:FecR domain-containing protein [Caulobacteraceae bacterium]
MNWRMEHQRRESAEREAISWLLRLHASDATEADWLAHRAWLEAAPAHRDAYDRTERVSAELSAAAPELVRALGSRIPGARRTRVAARRPMARPMVWRAVGGLAAAAAAAVLFVAIRPVPPVPTQVYQTAKGENRMLELADGSHIHLNSASRISVRLERKARYVDLAEGEAAFDVAKDTARPFLIAVGDRSIRVVGTEFDVLRHEGMLRVTVRRGVVAVQPLQTAMRGEPVLLRAGDQLEHEAGGRVSTVQKVDPEAAFAWRGGDLVYQDEPLEEVVADLNRYFATPVRVTGPASDLRFSGVLAIDTEDQVLRRLQGFLPIAVDREPSGVTLRMRTAAR